MSEKKTDWRPSEDILQYIMETESFRPRVYKDGNGIKTIGYGFIDPKIIKKYDKKGSSMSKKEAEKIFRDKLVPEFTRYLVDTTENFHELSDKQRDALFSYIYNIGYGSYTRKSPSMHEALKNKDWESVAQNIDFGYNDEKNKGLRKRRNYERELFGFLSDENGNVYPIGEGSTNPYQERELDKDLLVKAIISSKNALELQDPLSTSRGEAFREARKRGDNTFEWNGKKYSTDIKEDGGAVNSRTPLDPSILNEMYEQDLNRVRNGEKAIYFGNLNDKPLENSHPELIFSPLLSSFAGFLEGLDNVRKGDYLSAAISAGLGSVPYLSKKLLSKFKKELKTRNVLKEFNDSIERFGNDQVRRYDGKLFRSKTSRDLANYYNIKVMEDEGALGADRLLHHRPERVNPNGVIRPRYNNNNYKVEDLKRSMSDDDNFGQLVKVWWSESDPRAYPGANSSIVSIKKDLDRMDMKSQKYIRDDVHVSNALDLTDPDLDAKVYRAYYDDMVIPESHRVGPAVYEYGGTTREEAEDYIFSYLTSNGFKEPQAIAIIANLIGESGLQANITRKGGSDFGLQQWIGPRKKALYEYAREIGHEEPTFDDQLDFLIMEYNGEVPGSGWNFQTKGKNLHKGNPDKFGKEWDYYQYGKGEFENADSVANATIMYNQGFGRAYKQNLRNDFRVKQAERLAEKFGVDVGVSGMLSDNAGNQSEKQDQSDKTFEYPESYSSSEDRFEKWFEDYGKDLVLGLNYGKTEEDVSSGVQPVMSEMGSVANEENEKENNAYPQNNNVFLDRMVDDALMALNYNVRGMSKENQYK